MHLSDNVRDLESSATIAVATLCRELRAQGRDIIDLSAGEPDFSTPDFVAQAGIAAIQQGFTHYTAVPGLPELRKAIASHLNRTTGKATDAAGVVVTAGAKQALFNALFTLFGPGDEVLLPTPYWTSYPEMIKLARATPVLVRAGLDTGFKITPAQLEAQASPRSRGLILNSPANPTGAVYTLDELTAIARWAADRDLWIISDQIYERLCFGGGRAPGLLDLADALLARAVVVNGASKAFAMTGWRIGYSYSDPTLAGHMAALQSHITSNASTPAQHAALVAYRDEPRIHDAVQAMVDVFQHRRDLVVDGLRRHLPAADFIAPDGGFYVFFRVRQYYSEELPDSVAFCHWLLARTGVALVPGTAFGNDDFVRLSFTAPAAQLTDALARLGNAVQQQPDLETAATPG